MSKRGKGKGDPPTVYQTEDGELDVESIAADLSRFEIAAGLHGRDTDGFTAWNDLGVMDEEALITALIGNRFAALDVLTWSGFNPPKHIQSAALDPGKARRLADLAKKHVDRQRWERGVMAVLLDRMAADILNDWATFRENAITFPTWQRDAAMVRILGRGASFVFFFRDAQSVADAAKAVMRAEQERTLKSDGGRGGGQGSAKVRASKAKQDADHIRSEDAKRNIPIPLLARRLGFSESKVRRALKRK